jgi:hypothetical protein
MKKIIYSFAVLLAAAFILAISPSCTKTVTNTVTDSLKHAWQQVQEFNLTTTQALTSVNIGDSILEVGSGDLFAQAPVNRGSFNYFYWVLMQGTSFYSPSNGTPFLNGKFCSYATATTLYVMKASPGDQHLIVAYTPVFSDSIYNSFNQPYLAYPTSSSPSPAYPIVHNKYVLTPVEIYKNNQERVRFDLLNFDSIAPYASFGVLDTPTVKKIYLTPAPGTIGFFNGGYYCASYYNKFFVYFESQFYRIDTAGNVKSFGYTPASYTKNYGISNMFTYGNTLFVNSGGIFFSSTDQGETWSVFNDFSNTGVGSLLFRNVGNDLYATANDADSQLWKVAISGNNLNFSELNNDGLQTNPITSITPCGKYIFITTLSGVFYRDRTLFDQLKTPIR